MKLQRKKVSTEVYGNVVAYAVAYPGLPSPAACRASGMVMH